VEAFYKVSKLTVTVEKGREGYLFGLSERSSSASFSATMTGRVSPSTSSRRSMNSHLYILLISSGGIEHSGHTSECPSLQLAFSVT
jgi:hypothetical protein